jgi:hypothetical protein
MMAALNAGGRGHMMATANDGGRGCWEEVAASQLKNRLAEGVAVA